MGPAFVVRAESEIDAPRAEVWDVLSDFERYPEWNPFTPEVRTTLEPGTPVEMRVVLWTGVRDQREVVRQVVPGERICWGMHMGAPWLVNAERCQWLEPLPGGRTRYVTEDRIAGVVAPLVLLLYGASMQRGFDGVARGLKATCERR